MKVAIYPGSFDPFTNGHLSMVKRASELFNSSPLPGKIYILPVVLSAGKSFYHPRVTWLPREE